MCPPETLPPSNHIALIAQNLTAFENSHPDEAANAFAAALTSQPVDGDILARETSEATRLGSAINPPRHPRTNQLLEPSIPGILTDRGTRSLVAFEYEELFARFMPRREDRRVQFPPPRAQGLVRGWLEDIHQSPDRMHEIGRAAGMDMVVFKQVVRQYLPAKLGVDSWVGQAAYDRLKRKGGFQKGELLFWEAWMGTGVQSMPGYVPFLGTGGEGTMVWRLNRWGVPTRVSAEERAEQNEIELALADSEQGLVSLGIQIANWLGCLLVDEYAHPLMHERSRRGLEGNNIIDAVVEILGHEWFELPFDDEERLWEWKYMRCMPISVGQYQHVFDG